MRFGRSGRGLLGRLGLCVLRGGRLLGRGLGGVPFFGMIYSLLFVRFGRTRFVLLEEVESGDACLELS